MKLANRSPEERARIDAIRRAHYAKQAGEPTAEPKPKASPKAKAEPKPKAAE